MNIIENPKSMIMGTREKKTELDFILCVAIARQKVALILQPGSIENKRYRSISILQFFHVCGNPPYFSIRTSNQQRKKCKLLLVVYGLRCCSFTVLHFRHTKIVLLRLKVFTTRAFRSLARVLFSCHFSKNGTHYNYHEHTHIAKRS